MAEELDQDRVAESIAELPDLKLTPKALERVRYIRDKQRLSSDHGLRVGVVGGGCSGFQYQLKFDTAKEGDRVILIDGVRVLVDELSLPYVAGTTVDYVEGLHGAGFKFDNPRASRTCGCGSSFSV